MDISILLWIQEYVRINWLDPVFILITTLGNYGVIWILASIGLMIPKRTRKVGIMCVLALAISVLINNFMLKNLVCRARPFDQFDALVCLIPHPTDYSFPSGHSAASVACGCLMWRKLPRKIGLPALVLAISIAFSRLYIGVHFPSDVLVGIISGVLISYIAEWIILRIENHRKSKNTFQISADHIE